jgi:glucoamylase
MKPQSRFSRFLSIGLMSCLSPVCFSSAIAPGAPGVQGHWSYAGKTGIGTSYESYKNGQFSDQGSTGKISKVWFSLAQGVITETMFGLIHEAQLQEIQLLVKGKDFLHEEKKDMISSIDYLHKDAQGRPLSLAYKIINKDKLGRYEIEKHVFTDPHTNSLVFKVFFRALADDVTAYVYINPNMANTSGNDQAWHKDNAWFASDGSTALCIKTDAKIAHSTVGFEGVSDGINDLKAQGKLTQHYKSTGDALGNVAMTLALPAVKKGATGEWLFSVSFARAEQHKGANSASMAAQESLVNATTSLATGYQTLLNDFNGKGTAIGWEDYIKSLPELERLSLTATDGGKLLYASALVLKAQEDKTHAGAMIASLSNPWGDTMNADVSQTGYKAVWPRDFYQVTMALLALGDTQTPKIAFEYLKNIQLTEKSKDYQGKPGWFLQKTHVNGEREWVSVQMDQTAMPIMLGHQLWKHQVLSNDELIRWYNTMLKSAAQFLAEGGKVTIDGRSTTITPPRTQQERWEEQGGYSPSTTAAVIAGLMAASDMAALAQDKTSAAQFVSAAENFANDIEKTMFTTQGIFKSAPANGNYFLRITANTNPNDQGLLEDRNAQGALNESEILDAGFLELVRYGVRKPLHSSITDSLPEIDNTQLADVLRVKYEFTFPGVAGTFPGWRRYGRDGYGEDTIAGRGYNATGKMLPEGRGRVWPIFTGERGQYELAATLAKGSADSKKLAELRNTYVKAMELFANSGYMIPEQVWDGVGKNDTYQFVLGEGTNSATPLAWSHAEYIKLLRSYADQKIWDNSDVTSRRFAH